MDGHLPHWITQAKRKLDLSAIASRSTSVMASRTRAAPFTPFSESRAFPWRAIRIEVWALLERGRENATDRKCGWRGNNHETSDQYSPQTK
mmetsp:Transcript_20586/g.43137  ORF Transcript_20586/g.43137 Transcript_20586/m.43137 type:complete len:91 (-) Transcript_20586:4-276(-)